MISVKNEEMLIKQEMLIKHKNMQDVPSICEESDKYSITK